MRQVALGAPATMITQMEAVLADAPDNHASEVSQRMEDIERRRTSAVIPDAINPSSESTAGSAGPKSGNSTVPRA